MLQPSHDRDYYRSMSSKWLVEEAICFGVNGEMAIAMAEQLQTMPDLEDDLEEARETIQRLESRVSELEAANATLSDQVDGFEEDLRAAESTVDKLYAQIYELMKGANTNEH